VGNARTGVREGGVRRHRWTAGEAPALLVAALASGLRECHEGRPETLTGIGFQDDTGQRPDAVKGFAETLATQHCRFFTGGHVPDDDKVTVPYDGSRRYG
jgi:hypothetical protein